MGKREEALTAKIVDAWGKLGSIRGVATHLEVSRNTVRNHLKEAGVYDDKPLFAGRMAALPVVSRPLPKEGEVARYLLTSAQNNTKVGAKVFDTMVQVADHYDAEMMIGTFSYNKASYGSKSTKRGRGPATTDTQEVWYDPEIEPFIVDEPVQLAPGLQWRGEMNILPTAVRPLSGLESYTGRQSGIFPHVKVAMNSVVSGKNEATKFNYTTGTVTKRNYIQKKEGLKAEFHHVYGGLLVEVDSDGDWFVRQIIVDDNGVAHDLRNRFDGKEVTDCDVEIITWGDIHRATLSDEMREICWDINGIAHELNPKYQILHDLLDFRARNAHILRKSLVHERFANFCAGHDSVEAELREVAEFLHEIRSHNKRAKIKIVDSNHDQFMLEWLRIGDYKDDPLNAVYFLRAQLHVYETLQANPKAKINLLRWAVERFNKKDRNVDFLDQDDPCVILDIEHGMHGHLGGNGARGSALNATKMGRKVNRGHEHSASIVDGVYTAGISGDLNQGYNTGPSSWSHSHILTYPNGKRAIVTMWNGKWRAPPL